jgi:hypothetical protein
MLNNLNIINEAGKINNTYNYIDMPEVCDLPPYNDIEKLEVLKRLTTLMASI